MNAATIVALARNAKDFKCLRRLADLPYNRRAWYTPRGETGWSIAAVADAFQEVEEDVRRDELLKWWKRNGPYVAVLVVVIALIAAGFSYWRNLQEQKREAQGVQLQAAQVLQRDGRPADAAKILTDLAAEGGAGQRAVAALQAAAAFVAAKDVPGAIAAYDRLAADSTVEKEWRDLASVYAALHALDVEQPAAVEKRLAPIAVEGNIWRHAAREVLAAAKLKAGDTAAARQAFQQLADDATAPAGARARAAELLAALGPKA